MADRTCDLSPEGKQAFEDAAQNKPVPSNRRIVREMLPSIRDKLKAGWTYEAIRQELMRSLGFKGTLRTLYNYVWHFSRKDASPPAALPATAPDNAMKPARRSVRETLCGLPPDLPAAGQKRTRVSLVDKLNRPI